jgi:hypothetical protein
MRGSSGAAGRRPGGWTSARFTSSRPRWSSGSSRSARRHPGPRHTLGEAPTLRRVAREQFAWRRDVKGGAPSTLRDNEAFLRELDGEGIGPKTVNKHRELLHAVFNYVMRSDTHGDRVKPNPVTETGKRRQPPTAPLDHYERHEIEALVRASTSRVATARHGTTRAARCSRAPTSWPRRPPRIAQDAAAFSLMFYSGLRHAAGSVLAQQRRPHHDPRLPRPREPVDHQPLPALEARRHRRRGDERRARNRVLTLRRVGAARTPHAG